MLAAQGGQGGGSMPSYPGAPNPIGGSPAAGGGYYAPPQGSDQAAEGYAGAQDAYNRALIRFNQQRTGLLQQYGYGGTIDPASGMLTNLHVDTGSTHGGLQTLLHNQAQEDQQAQFAAEDRGLVGGLANQGASDLHYLHAGQSSDLANQLLGNLGDLNSQQLDAKATLDQALWQLQHGATTDAIDSGAFNPADLTSPDGGSAPPRVSGSPSQIAQASMAAKVAAQKAGRAAPAVALAARSAGMNAAYGLAARAAAKSAPKAAPANAYTNPKSKKRG